jgi:ABC-type transport system substrate-binding protein
MKRFILLGVIVLVLIGTLIKKQIHLKQEKEINFSVDNIIKTFDPAIAFNDDALFTLGQSLETLYQYHYLKRPYEVIPSLADGMPEVIDNGLTYIIKIKKGVHYHNFSKVLPPNRTVVSDDFIWQIKRLAFNPVKSTGRWLFEDRIKGFKNFSKMVGDDIEKFYTTQMEGLKKIDDLTFEIHLNEPSPNILYFLSMQFTSPTPIEVIQKYNNKLDKVIEGTGPYKFLGLTDMVYHFEKFNKFRKESYPTSGDRYANTENLLKSSKELLPLIERLNIKVYTDEKKKWDAFLDNELDILTVPKKKITDVLDRESKAYKALSESGVLIKHFSRQSTRWLGFNMTDPIIGKNLNLRKAIAHAIDYETYVKVISKNTNLKANSLFNPSIQGYNPTHELPYSFNLELALKYLKKSKVDLGQFELIYSTRGKQAIHLEEAKFLKKQLGRIGIKVKIHSISFPEFLKLGRSGKLQFWTDSWIYDYPDAENLLQLLVSQNHPGINKSGFSDVRIDKLYKELSRTINPQERLKLMYKIEKIVEKEIPWILMMYESTYILQKSEIRNFRKSFFIRNFVKYLKK